METVLGLTFAAFPLALAVTLLVVTERRQARRQAEVARQVTLTDALHARVGAAVAPVVRRGRDRWRISVAVPTEQPAVVDAVLRTVDEVFARADYELALHRQAAPAGPPVPPRAPRTAQESLSWT